MAAIWPPNAGQSSPARDASAELVAAATAAISPRRHRAGPPHAGLALMQLWPQWICSGCARANGSSTLASPAATLPRFAPSPVASGGEIRVMKLPVSVRQTTTGSKAAPRRIASCGAPLAIVSVATEQRGVDRSAAMPADGDRHYSICPKQRADLAQRGMCLVGLAQHDALGEVAVLDPGPQRVEQNLSDARLAGEAVGRMAQMVQRISGLVQGPFGDQRRKHGGRHPQDGTAPHRQGGEQMIEAVQGQLGTPTARRVAAQECQLVEAKHGQVAPAIRSAGAGAAAPEDSLDPLREPMLGTRLQPGGTVGRQVPISLR